MHEHVAIIVTMEIALYVVFARARQGKLVEIGCYVLRGNPFPTKRE